jgi:hypothetical protein
MLLLMPFNTMNNVKYCIRRGLFFLVCFEKGRKGRNPSHHSFAREYDLGFFPPSFMFITQAYENS